VAVAVGGPAVGLFGGSGDSRVALGRSFAAFDVGAPPLAPGAIASETRVITSATTSDGSHTLYVSPTTKGGFCYEWTGWMVSCNPLRTTPFWVSWGKTRVLGTVSSVKVSSVEIEFTDGTSAKPEISWISSPINAGFFLYEIPAGKTVAQIKGLNGGHTSAQVTWFSV